MRIVPGILLAAFSFTIQAGGEVPQPIKKVVVIGNSITRHAPSEKLGWQGDWGMAASSPEKDYVHLFLSKVKESQKGVEPELLLVGKGGGKVDGEIKNASQFTAFKPDLVIVQLGENDKNPATFQQSYENLLRLVRESAPSATILCLGVWAPPSGNSEKDEMIKSACVKFGAHFADLNAANKDPGNKAKSENRFTNAGVNWHPGDAGMAAYADALWQAFKKRSSAPAAKEAPVKPVAVTPPANPLGPYAVSENWTGNSPLAWKSPPVTEQQGEGSALHVQSADPAKRVLFATPLPAEALNGKTLEIRTRIKGSGISAPPQKHNGVKLMVKLTNAEQEVDFPQFKNAPTGTFDWQDVTWTCAIPSNIISMELILGLEKVSGDIWFGPLTLTAK